MSEIYARDRASQALGMELLDCGDGRTRVRMRVTGAMIQGHNTCHGGYVFTLADSAFAFACNRHGYATVASGCSIEYLRPVLLDDVLTAEAVEVALAGRSGVYDVAVSNQGGEVVALFRGRSRRIQV